MPSPATIVHGRAQSLSGLHFKASLSSSSISDCEDIDDVGSGLEIRMCARRTSRTGRQLQVQLSCSDLILVRQQDPSRLWKRATPRR